MISSKKLLCLLIAIFMVFALASCGSNIQASDSETGTDKVTDAKPEPGSTQSASNDDTRDDAAEGPEPNILPIANGDVELTLYSFFPPGARQVYVSMAEHPVVQIMMEQTGLNLKFIHPPENDDGTFFNVTIASGDYPDLILDPFNRYPGGPEGAVEDGVLINMNDLIYRYAPNYLKLLEEKGELVKKRSVSDSGMIVRFGTIFQPPILEGRISNGLMARADWLRKLNMNPPETIDEYTEVLRAFRDQLNVEVPLALPKAGDGTWKQSNVFASAFGITHDGFYVDDGQVKYSKIQPAYKDYLELLRMYYAEGLLDQDFANRNQNDSVKMLQNGTAAVTLMPNHMTIQSLTLGKMEDPEYDLVGLKYPRKNKGDQLHLSLQVNSVTPRAWFVSATCEHPVEAVKFIDYLYMPETQELTAWGPGNEEYPTYTIVDGKKQFTDFMMNNPDIDYLTARQRYTANTFQIMWHNEMEAQQYDNPVVHQAWDAWIYNNDQLNLIPDVMTLTPDESREFASIMNTINTYSSEMFYKYVTGLESLDTFDAFVDQIKTLGIDNAISIQQAAYDRYNAR